MNEVNEAQRERPGYPFCAIVGQQAMKEGLILNIINPWLGGILLRGEKGTAKSTAVRALADVLPVQRRIAGCRFGCDPDDDSFWCAECQARYAGKEGGRDRKQAQVRPTDWAETEIVRSRMQVINLPVSATEDRVVGTLDIEYALKEGKKKFEPGILAEVNRNILYVDEVNLLDDHVVDVLLDAAAMGVNSIEREGISYSHPSRFVLIGTMNPEEGDLRPQLLDRFGLVVDVYGEEDVEARVEVIKRRLAYEGDPVGFAAAYREEQATLSRKIAAAQRLLPQVTYSPQCLRLIAEIAVQLGVDGHRADLTFIKAAMAHAAYMGRTKVEKADLLTAARLALPHRLRRKPFEEGVLDQDALDRIISAATL